MKEAFAIAFLITGAVTGSISAAVADADDRAGAALRGGFTGLLTSGAFLGLTAGWNAYQRSQRAQTPVNPPGLYVDLDVNRSGGLAGIGSQFGGRKKDAQVGVYRPYEPPSVIVKELA